ncbi:alanine racemase [Streptomyces winkii]|uniref:alanine racemase n=1 Tax=Streptomyces winkii TaxID=3051178 RepID=UPI0028D5A539|nr:alanine racemase [Streptomyces sp. DSM 40971]
MFLDTVLARNPELADAAAALHRDGAIPPDTYVVDRDAVEANAALLAERGERLGLSLWFVVKQLGRNPELIAAVARHLPSSAAIDAPEARTLHAAGARTGNVGHLVQIPRRALPEVLAWRPEAVTVFDTANARAVSDEARRQGFVQDVLLRMQGAPGTVYPGQEGGVPPEGVDGFAEEAEALPGVRIAGVTGFPCLLCDPATGTPRPTETFAVLREARARLERRGHHGLKLSAPGATSAAALPLLAELGATHGEPGHALTGTTPLHALDPGQPERPGYVYVTEVAHTLADGRPALHGGGFYPRAGIRDALLHRTGLRLRVQDMPAENIDYYRLLDAPPTGAAPVRAGDTAVLAFRTQMFVTRSSVAVVSGLSLGAPELTGLYDSFGRAL